MASHLPSRSVTPLPHLQPVAILSAWIVAVCWLWNTIAAARGLPRVPNLFLPQYDRTPTDDPTITVIVPARNEAADIAATLLSLLNQDYPVQIIAIDDRSTDATGAIIEELTAKHSANLRCIHIEALPDGWLGKTHAMAVAGQLADTDYLLFTDADIVFRNDAIRRSLTYAVASGADHLVTVPTPVTRSRAEAPILGFFQIFGLWSARPWRIADPDSLRDAIGIGAFNLLRRQAYLQVGGFESLRMEIVEDLGLGRRIKRAHLAQRVAFGRDLVRVHWASGANGLVQVLTKNLFAATGFRIWLALLGCLWLLVFCVGPFVGLLFAATRLPSLLAVLAILYAYRLFGKHSGISPLNGLLAPWGALLFLFALLRSMTITLLQGGVMWRGTFYPLAELRKHAGPLV